MSTSRTECRSMPVACRRPLSSLVVVWDTYPCIRYFCAIVCSPLLITSFMLFRSSLWIWCNTRPRPVMRGSISIPYRHVMHKHKCSCAFNDADPNTRKYKFYEFTVVRFLVSCIGHTRCERCNDWMNKKHDFRFVFAERWPPNDYVATMWQWQICVWPIMSLCISSRNIMKCGFDGDAWPISLFNSTSQARKCVQSTDPKHYPFAYIQGYYSDVVGQFNATCSIEGSRPMNSCL